MKPKNPFKVLSIDGGGIKGLYSSRILDYFEEYFDCSLADTFDMVCGTSTGGLIALGVSQGIPVSKITSLYKNKGHLIFPRQPKVLRWLKRNTFIKLEKRFLQQLFWFGKYSAEPLKHELTELFGEKTIGESLVHLCIPSYSITKGHPRVFKNDHHNLNCDNSVPYVDVALATSAAPTYLPIHSIKCLDNEQFIDGGVWANNPTHIGYLDALKFFINSQDGYDGIEILSIASISHHKAQNTNWRKNRSFKGWGGKLFEVMMNGQSKGVDYTMQTIAEADDRISYTRIESPALSSDQQAEIDMDITHSQAIDLMLIKARDQASRLVKQDIIINFFN